MISIAAVQRQLSMSRAGEVALRGYFVQLCESLGTSMIHDPKRVSISVTVDDSVVNADTSVSLGLILTELVINALKHAFPGKRRGRIVVDYRAEGSKWSLSVSDDGIGMSQGENAPKPGLGSGIVEALTRQLRGEIKVSAARPGTSVLIVRTETSSLNRDLPAAA